MTLARHQHVASLDGLRGLAAFGVVIFHIGGLWSLSRPNHLYLAVPFFFTLSGYVVARSYEQKLLTSMSLKRFALIRLIRLYPMLFASLVIAAALGFSFHDVGMGLLFIPSLAAASLFPANGPQWSLFTELLGNAVHAAFAPILTNVALIVMIAIAFIACLFTSYTYSDFVIGWSADNFLGGVSVFGLTYPIGILLFRIEKLGKLPKLEVPLILLAVVYGVFTIGPQSWTTQFRAYPDLFVSCVIFPAILVLSLHATAQPWLNRLCKLGGDLSYPIYIIHHPILVAAGAFVVGTSWTHMERRIFALVVVAGITGLAYVLLKFFDEPVRKALSARFLHRQLVDERSRGGAA